MDPHVLLTLQTWFSPSLPTGAYTHSHGLEAAIDAGEVRDASAAGTWISRASGSGGLANDAALCAASWHAAGDAHALAELDDLARALVAGRERLAETLHQGAAFTAAVAPGQPQRALPVAIGAAARGARLPLEPTLLAMLQNAAANLVWIGARLVPYGQREALALVEATRPVVIATAARAREHGLDALGNNALGFDLASLAHEAQRSRVCRT